MQRYIDVKNSVRAKFVAVFTAALLAFSSFGVPTLAFAADEILENATHDVTGGVKFEVQIVETTSSGNLIVRTGTTRSGVSFTEAFSCYKDHEQASNVECQIPEDRIRDIAQDYTKAGVAAGKYTLVGWSKSQDANPTTVNRLDADPVSETGYIPFVPGTTIYLLADSNDAIACDSENNENENPGNEGENDNPNNPTQTYTLSFDANGGTLPNGAITAMDNFSQGNIPDVEPTFEGHTFMGWSTVKLDGENQTASEVLMPGDEITIEADTVLYAVWKSNDYIVLYINEGESPKKADVLGGGEYAIESAKDCGFEAPEGKEFSHWVSLAADGKEYKPGDVVTGTTTLLAVWKDIEPRTFTMEYVAPDGTITNDTVTASVLTKEFTVAATPNMAGYTVLGWSTDQNATEAEYAPGDTIVLDGTDITTPKTTLYAVAVETANLSYMASGATSGSAPAGATEVKGTEIVVADKGTLERTGSEFKGWARSENATEAELVAGDKLTLENTTILYPVWYTAAPTFYTLSYAANGATGVPSAEQVAISNPAIVTTVAWPESMTRSGYRFLGWSDNPYDEVARFTQGAVITMDSNKTLWAVWQELATVVYDANGGSYPPASHQPVDVGETVTVKGHETMVRDGFTFQGWSTDQNASEATILPQSTLTTTAQGTTKLYAVWSQNPADPVAVDQTPADYNQGGNTTPATPANPSPSPAVNGNNGNNGNNNGSGSNGNNNGGNGTLTPSNNTNNPVSDAVNDLTGGQEAAPAATDEQPTAEATGEQATNEETIEEDANPLASGKQESISDNATPLAKHDAGPFNQIPWPLILGIGAAAIAAICFIVFGLMRRRNEEDVYEYYR